MAKTSNPFEVKLQARKPIEMKNLSVNEMNAELEKGYSDYLEGKVEPLVDVVADIYKDYGL